MKLWKLESIRGLAAVYVVCGHFFEGKYFLLRFGQEAVMIFFILSGFVIEYSFQKGKDTGFNSYFWKRFLRIYSVLIVMFIAASLIERPDLADSSFLSQLLGNLLMLQDFGTGKPNVIVPTLFASALWSLHYEWWFYMLYYPTNKLLKKRKQCIYVGISSLFCAIAYGIHPNALYRLLMYFVIWWTGVEMARSFSRNKKVFLRELKFPLAMLISISGILAINSYIFISRGNEYSLGIHPILEMRHFIAAILTVFVALLWQKSGWFGFKILKFGTLIAPISYSLYIAHQPLFINANYLDFINYPPLEKFLYLGFLLLFCYVCELKLYPFLRLKFKTSRKPPSVLFSRLK